MKCIKDVEGKVSRLKDESAHKLVKVGDHQFCPKDEWKKQEKLGQYKPAKKPNKKAKDEQAIEVEG